MQRQDRPTTPARTPAGTAPGTLAPLAAAPVTLAGPPAGTQPGPQNGSQSGSQNGPNENSAAGEGSLGVQTGEPSTDAITAQQPAEKPTGFWDPHALTGSNTLAGILMAGGVLIFVFILMGRMRKGRHIHRDDMTTMERVEAIRARAGDRSNIDAFKADAHDFTRQMAALLDSKAERLEQLIADADERLARLEAAQRESSNRNAQSHSIPQNHAYTRDEPARPAPQRSNPTPPPTPWDEDDPQATQPDRSIPAEQDELRIPDLRGLGEPHTPPAHTRPGGEEHDHRSVQGQPESRAQNRPQARPQARPQRGVEPEPPVDPMHDRIYRLADDGLDPVAIARETGQPTGQIELILALRG